MKFIRIIAVLLMIMLLCSCSKTEEPKENAAVTPAAEATETTVEKPTAAPAEEAVEEPAEEATEAPAEEATETPVEEATEAPAEEATAEPAEEAADTEAAVEYGELPAMVSNIIASFGLTADQWLTESNYRALFTATFILEAYEVEGYMMGEKMTTGIPKVFMYKAAVETGDCVGMDMYMYGLETGEPLDMISVILDPATCTYIGFTDKAIADPTVYYDEQITNGAITEYYELTLEELQNGMTLLGMLIQSASGTAE